MRISNLVFVLATATVSTLAVSSSTAASDNVKPFRPMLKSKTKFTVYKNPVALDGYFVQDKSEDSAAVGNAAAEFISKTSRIPVSNIRITSSYTDTASGITHVYLVQTVSGKDVANSVANVNVSKGKVISSSHSFAPLASVHQAAQTVDAMKSDNKGESAKSALKALAKHIGHNLSDSELGQAKVSTVNSIQGGHYLLIEDISGNLSLDGNAIAEQSYIQDAKDQLVPAWRVNIEQTNHWWNAHVSMDGKVLKLTDWYANSESYNVYPKNVNSPNDGPRKIVVDPANKDASPKGW
ncbi:hypothetical protein LPJ73_000860, partial [Coemansia sp. RSA 2703]